MEQSGACLEVTVKKREAWQDFPGATRSPTPNIAHSQGSQEWTFCGAQICVFQGKGA